MSPVRILGIGSPFGDDRVGWEVIARLRTGGYLARFPAGAIAAECCDRPGAGLVAHLAGADRAILVDAMRSGAAPGTIRRLADTDIDATAGLLSSHGFGLAEALALARALGAAPRRLIVFGVELSRARPGDEMSPAVRAAIPEVLAYIARELVPSAHAAAHAG